MRGGCRIQTNQNKACERQYSGRLHHLMALKLAQLYEYVPYGAPCLPAAKGSMSFFLGTGKRL